MPELDGFLAGLVADCSPGAVLLVLRDGEVEFEGAAGVAQRGVPGRPMRTDTIFDLGSITKIAVTTAVVMTLVERGVLDPDAPIASWLERFPDERVTATHLLTHRAGLWEWWPTYVVARDPGAAIDLVCSLPARYALDVERHYSDLGFMLLGEVVRRSTGEELDQLAARLVFDPLGMCDTGYRPPASLRARIAATSHGDDYERAMIATREPYPVDVDASAFHAWREHTLVGEANDGNAHHAFGGVAGHAGLFSTARDLGALGRALAERRLWNDATVERFTRDHVDPGQGLGFWTRRLEAATGRATGFGHSGFPGTELIVVPEDGLVVVLLTNRLHARRAARPIAPWWRELLALL